jgi:hypothetical protein
MSVMVELLVIIKSDQHATIAERASRALVGIWKQEDSDEKRDAIFFLNDLAARRDWTEGARGVERWSTWMIQGNYSNAAEFVKILSEFWLSLFEPCTRANGVTIRNLANPERDDVQVISQSENESRATVRTIQSTDDGNLLVAEKEVDLSIC